MACPRLCVTTMSVSAGASVFNSASIASVVTGSSDDVGSSRSSTSGSTAKGAGKAQELLLSPGEPEGRVVEAVLDGVPETDPVQTPLAHHVELLSLGDAVRLHAGHDVVLDRHRERVGPLEEHPDPPAQRQQVDVLLPEADVVEEDLARARAKPGTLSFIRLSVRRKVD